VAQAWQSGADLNRLNGKKVTLIANPGWRFAAETVVDQWAQWARSAGKEIAFRVAHWDWGQPGSDWPLPRVAVSLREAEITRKLAEFVAEQGKDADHLLLPPLVLEATTATALSQATSVPWSECLPGIEPVAGYRLQAAIRGWAMAQGITLLSSSQCEPKVSGGRLDHLAVYGTGGWTQIGADLFVLASGKYTGGGLDLTVQGPCESLLGLPVSTTGTVGTGLDAPGHFRRTPHWREAGLRVDREFRPLGKDDRPVLENLVACGSIIGGIDYARERVGIGYFLHLGQRGVANRG
jgi:glycerol-3-phosphate dehydrogenase subunit B